MIVRKYINTNQMFLMIPRNHRSQLLMRHGF